MAREGCREQWEFLENESFPIERNVIILLKLRRITSGLPSDQPGTELLFRDDELIQLSLKSVIAIIALSLKNIAVGERVHDICCMQ